MNKQDYNKKIDNRKTPINDTSWGNVALWYDELLEKGNDTYQKELILPNLTCIMDIKKGEKILDIACGQGFFSREFFKLGANVTGVDISKELIEKAKNNSPEAIRYFVSSSDRLTFVEEKTFDKIVIVLALQNIEKIKETMRECNKALNQGGKIYIVLNHPTFRIPKKSDWGYDNKKDIQFRRIEQYFSELMLKIDMNPGEKDIKNKKYTFSFHRPLQFYFKIFKENSFLVSGLEEWCSHKSSQNGPKKKAEDRARKEIPIFMCIELVKNNSIKI
ncbi:MAG: class I SAM-dependent methyltransferase [Candidatus Paceibacterota bacterium]|jgi:ubiquinone/menaquinone biosynthesis C-methylase UbiE